MVAALGGEFPSEVDRGEGPLGREVIEGENEVVGELCRYLYEVIAVWGIELLGHDGVDSGGLHVDLVEDDLAEVQALEEDFDSDGHRDGVGGGRENAGFDVEVYRVQWRTPVDFPRLRRRWS